MSEIMAIVSNPDLYGIHGIVILTSLAALLVGIGYRAKIG